MKTLWPLVVVVLACPAARAQVFSPGPLSQPHHNLEGLAHCTECHQGARGLTQQKCLACHTELQPEITAHQGFHGRIPDAERACQSCHHEHQGLHFALIEWVPSKKGFPHAKTGWALEGKHQTTACDDCHAPRRIADPSIRAMLAKLPQRRTYLGLPTACAGCHFDEHRGELRGDCASCHTARDWKHTPGFHHENTAYPLRGKHRQVACAKCHPAQKDPRYDPKAFPAPRAETFLKLTDIAHRGCDSCHADPHKGKFTQRCEACHTEVGWQKIRGAAEISRDFHQKTRFPLRGLHLEVDCRACHGPFPGKKAKFKGLAFGQCADCHPDAHEGQLAAVGRPALDCAGCHAESGFLPARYTLEDHARTRFRLEGGHRAVPCNACHPAVRALLDRIPATVRRTLARERRKPLFSAAALVVPGDLARCETCHRDPHAGQFASQVKRAGCPACHLLASFHALHFDHDRDTRYPLEGPHKTAPCEGCHRSEGGVVRYAGVATDCQACHEDVHRGQFADAAGKIDCARCHTVSDFKQAPRFVHAPPFTDFRLDGAHARTSCTSCHREVSLRGARVERFLGLPTTCAGCHQDFHRGAFRGFSP